MEDYDIVSIEMELDRLRDEREERENSAPATGATGANLGCGTMLLMLVGGMLLLRAITELLSLFFQS